MRSASVGSLPSLPVMGFTNPLSSPWVPSGNVLTGSAPTWSLPQLVQPGSIVDEPVHVRRIADNNNKINKASNSHSSHLSQPRLVSKTHRRLYHGSGRSSYFAVKVVSSFIGSEVDLSQPANRLPSTGLTLGICSVGMVPPWAIE